MKLSFSHPNCADDVSHTFCHRIHCPQIHAGVPRRRRQRQGRQQGRSNLEKTGHTTSRCRADDAPHRTTQARSENDTPRRHWTPDEKVRTVHGQGGGHDPLAVTDLYGTQVHPLVIRADICDHQVMPTGQLMPAAQSPVYFFL